MKAVLFIIFAALFVGSGCCGPFNEDDIIYDKLTGQPYLVVEEHANSNFGKDYTVCTKQGDEIITIKRIDNGRFTRCKDNTVADVFENHERDQEILQRVREMEVDAGIAEPEPGKGKVTIIYSDGTIKTY